MSCGQGSSAGCLLCGKNRACYMSNQQARPCACHYKDVHMIVVCLLNWLGDTYLRPSRPIGNQPACVLSTIIHHIRNQALEALWHSSPNTSGWLWLGITFQSSYGLLSQPADATGEHHAVQWSPGIRLQPLLDLAAAAAASSDVTRKRVARHVPCKGSGGGSRTQRFNLGIVKHPCSAGTEAQ